MTKAILHGIMYCPVGDYANPQVVERFASIAESSGWEGFFMNDHVVYDRVTTPPVLDVWIGLTIVASVTANMQLGALMVPLCHRQPDLIANNLRALSWLAPDRIVLGVGLGSPPDDYELSHGLEGAEARRMKSLRNLRLIRENLARVVMPPWIFPSDSSSSRSSNRVISQVWFGGRWPGSTLSRDIALCDGVFFERPTGSLSPLDVRDIRSTYAHVNSSLSIAVEVMSPPSADAVSDLVDAGATWILQYVGWRNDCLSSTESLISAGPTGDNW